uniref:NADH-ubiquinone oxidoreductase chain 6 n=1 Tax=Leptopeza flavipes TaxID=1209091 RepID=A0A7L8EYX1_9MUSC|nr:NADH dehydrogenase subunit 6 [Leptopeza flavipes]QOE17374.1 NADH dehydrogenase subunit 6 [Leptopeza flavipes]UJG45147.1 NADH dehydrogenase subunit 6 [Leptopeza flavipes]
MVQMIMYLLTLISSLIFMQMNHPLAMGLMLLLQTFLICLITGLLTKTFWFSYILFLIFLGGMLVLFIYVTSLASNEMFSLSSNLIFISFMMISMLLLFMIVIDKMNIYPLLYNNEMNEMYNLNSFIQENSLMLNKLYNYPTNLISILLIIYLLITLIVIVKITNIFYGPLRMMN